LDIQLRKTQDPQAAYAFMKGLVKTFGKPTVLITDKAPALLCAFKKLMENDFCKHTTHCTIKYLNNLIEQDHRHVKRCFSKSAGFQSIRYVSRTIKEIETVHALYKQRRRLQTDSAFSVYHELQQLLVVT
jgi:putative transposase